MIGLAFVYLGLAALRVVPDPFVRLSSRFPNARLVVIGALIGGFLIGRPFPLFHKLFEYAAETRNPLYGAAVFILQSLGNITLMAVLFVVLVHATRGRFTRWMTAGPSRVGDRSVAERKRTLRPFPQVDRVKRLGVRSRSITQARVSVLVEAVSVVGGWVEKFDLDGQDAESFLLGSGGREI
ncbi:hypothetical protein [Streptosporangium roseum]|uniref:hypothetical protein n=1 Tax=Streptosporangium roseum TaxID=2001 RepID=UPI00068FE47A|nr:hypothetical protein [Streptosporangium roseum]